MIPSERLPAGFAEQVEDPPTPPAEPRPAATVVLLRDAPEGAGSAGPPENTMAGSAGRSHGGSGQSAPEVLLLQRHHASGFVPGAYVFPGGRVDDEDASDAATALLERALPPRSTPLEPAPAFWVAAVREVFEETGVLLATDATGRPAPDALSEPHLAEWRERLMGGRAGLVQLLEAEGLLPAVGDIVYCAHWVTPVAEPRRYDTRFFVARLPAGREAAADSREMTDAIWETPAGALERFRRGDLPMVFPTVKMLEAIAGFPTVDAVLEAFRGKPVATVLPRLVRTGDGVGIVVD